MVFSVMWGMPSDEIASHGISSSSLYLLSNMNIIPVKPEFIHVVSNMPSNWS